jgi:pimeloyl-ACP methyl ester carboxylesterase
MQINNTRSNSIVFIHGLSLNSRCWAEWMTFFEARKFSCYAFSYPHHEGEPEALRKNPPKEIRHIGFRDVVDHFREQITRLPEKPILIGHSMGGAVVQKLLDEGVGVAGVCINSAPPRGVFCFKPQFFFSNLPMINPFAGNSILLPNVKAYHQVICNTMSLAETKVIYDRFVVPESRNIPRSLVVQGKVDFKKPHPPLLFIAGEKDRIIPKELNRNNYLAYTDKSSSKELKVFEGRAHSILWERGWQEVTDHILNWITKIQND